MGQAALDDYFQSPPDDGTLPKTKGLPLLIGFVPFDGEEMADEPVEYNIDGVKVLFPFEAYPCQQEMLHNIIKTLNSEKAEHALLESPTGSGKSMALLCGVLGWLRRKREILRVEARQTVEGRKSQMEDNKMLTKDIRCCSNGAIDEDDFVSMPSKKAKIEDNDEEEIEEIVERLLPKIYVTSRTHRQIAQLVAELKRTVYRPKFVVLGSRTHYCINKDVRKAKDINEACREKAFSKDGGSCHFYNNMQKWAKSHGNRFTPDCDIEDLANMGKAHRFCPYYIASASLEHAEIVFAPYNYLVDPVVRSAMKIELRKQDVVIVDEAHNIEDVCRDSGSFEVTDDSLNAIQGELLLITKELKKNGKIDLLDAHECQGHVVSLLTNWLKHSDNTRGVIRRDFEQMLTIWQDKLIVEELQSFGIVHEQVTAWDRQLERILERSFEPSSKKDEEVKEHLLSFGSCQILRGFYNCLQKVLRDGNQFLNSYRMVKFQSTKVDNMGKRILFTLGFWCLNPEVIFRDLTTTCKAVILTSGTLSPMDTFSSELNTRFEQRLEALHIIGEKQTWVGCLPVGPEGSTFLGNFKTMDSFAYQDDLSRAILAVCKVIPAGVLVFLPSYSFLDKLLTRMQAIGVHDEISKQKKIYKEPRQGAPADFEKLMQNYYRTIRDCAGRLSGGLDGALLFAVYRGKISEGLDLKDDNCRAVIPVGIPYPAFKDPKVVLKREFNDRGSGRRLMSGQQWYESQAFRALNQALGRCIRHRHDWGAIVLLEQRFTSQRNVSQLSKWVRNRVRTFGEFQLAMQSLGEFVNGNMADETCSIHKENVIISSNDELQEGKACYIID